MKPSHVAALLNGEWPPSTFLYKICPKLVQVFVYIYKVLLLAFLISELTCEQAEQIDFYSGKYELNNEKKLINDLFSNYRVKFGRPVANRSEKVVVSFEVFLVQIIDLVINIFICFFFFSIFTLFNRFFIRMNVIKFL